MKARDLAKTILHLPRAGIILNEQGVPLAYNNMFTEIFGPPPTDTPLNLTGDEKIPELYSLLAGNQPGWRGNEIPLFLRETQKHAPFWCEVFTFITEQEGLTRLLLLHDLSIMRSLEASYLQRLRRVADDNLWLFDENYRLLWVRSEVPAYENHLGKKAHDLILQADWARWDNALQHAKQHPGEINECTVRAAIDKKSRTVDISFLPGGLYGGRYYAASRSSDPTGSRIIRRLKEAWQVQSDTALAEKLGTSTSAISRANKAESIPPVWVLRTGEQTSTSLDWLVSGQGQKRLW